MGAIVGDENRRIESMKLAWEPVRFLAYVQIQTTTGKKNPYRNGRELRSFPWERREVSKGEVKKATREAAKIRKHAKEKWGLKYFGE